MNVTFRFCFRSPLKSLKLPVFKGLSTDLGSHSFLHISFYPLYIVVKYLDGVEFLIGKIKDIAQSQNCTFEASLEAREEGYYAAHLGVKQELTLIDERYTPTSHLINVEIQITTELQSLIKDLLHRYYEANRIKHNVQNSKWQWDYLCDEFNSNYLGHIVHYVEGKIVELRDKQ